MLSLSDIQQLRTTGAVEKRFLPTAPFALSKYHAERLGCDLAVPNASGIGNVLVCTPLVEALAMQLGRRIRLLTSEINPLVGKEPQDAYAIWDNNPYVKEIVEADNIDPQIMHDVNAEQDNISQFGHMIENICYGYGVVPRALRPCLYLTSEEQAAAIDRVESLRRPLIVVHAGGTSTSIEQSPWHIMKWRELCSELGDEVSFIQVAKSGFDQKSLGIPSPALTLREAMATIWACDMFIGFDSAPAHIATAFSKPSIILWDVQRKSLIEDRHYVGFGPASMIRWSYPQNRNLMILGQKDDALLPLCVAHIRKLIKSFKH